MTDTTAYLNDVFDALGASERRNTLRYLDGETDHVATLDDITGYLSDGVEEPDSERMRYSLVHTHLPKLADERQVDYDKRVDPGTKDTDIRGTFDVKTPKDRVFREYRNFIVDTNIPDHYADDVFETFSNAGRRRALYILEKEEDRTATVEDLVDYMSREPYDIDRPEQELSHAIIPRLQDYGWITQESRADEDTETVSLQIDEENDAFFLNILDKAYDQEII